MSRFGICPYKVTTVTHSLHANMPVNVLTRGMSNALVVVGCNLFATEWV